jgi:hypothetical protein
LERLRVMVTKKLRLIATASALASLAAVSAAVVPTVAAGADELTASSCLPLPQATPTHVLDIDTGLSVTVNHWSLGDLDVSQAIPPAGWSPLTASDDDLALYGFPPRPSDAVGLADWQAEFSSVNFSGVSSLSPSDMCQRSLVSAGGTSLILPDTDPVNDTTDDLAATAASSTGPNWGGLVDTGSGYTYIYGRIYQDTATNCPNVVDTHATWVGLGGYGRGTALLQNGTAQEAPVGSDYAWYEALNANHDTRVVSLGSAFPVAAGDEIAMSTHYVSGTDGHAIFYWHNYRTGIVDQIQINDKSVAGNISAYHDGHTAELIDERFTEFNSSSDNVGHYTPLRQHTVSHWHAATVHHGNGDEPVRSPSHTYLTMMDKNNTRLERPDSSPGARTDYDDNWKNCGAQQPAT